MSTEDVLLFGFAAFWILWVAIRGEAPGRWLVRFCEGPLMSSASFLDRRVAHIADFFVRFGRNPLEALRIREGELPALSLSASLILILLFFILYLILYLLSR
jgi:hypothetical protein